MKQIGHNRIRSALRRRSFIAGAGAFALVSECVDAKPGYGGTPGANNLDASNNSAWDALNILLRLKHIQAAFYSHAVHGPSPAATSVVCSGFFNACRQVNFQAVPVAALASNGSALKLGHAWDLRHMLGSRAAAPSIADLRASFTGFASKAKLIPHGAHFDPFLNDQNFLVSAFMVEQIRFELNDVLAGAAGLNRCCTLVAAMAAEDAGHVADLRALLCASGLEACAQSILDLFADIGSTGRMWTAYDHPPVRPRV